MERCKAGANLEVTRDRRKWAVVVGLQGFVSEAVMVSAVGRMTEFVARLAMSFWA